MIRQHTVITPYMVGKSHFYSVELKGELVLFDTGPPTEEAWETLSREIDLARLQHVFITHWHVDHCGQIKRIKAASDAVIYLSQLDAWKLQHQEKCLRLMSGELRAIGFDGKFQKKLYEQGVRSGLFSEGFDDCQVIEKSTEPARLGIEYLKCAGHSQSDLVFLVGDYAISGDILLPNVFQTPLLEIDLTTSKGLFDNYTAYCSSLVKFRQLRGLQILPGHRQVFDQLDEVVLFYVGKLRERAAQLKHFPAQTSVREIVETLFGEIMSNPIVTFLKASEVVFMLDYLARPELLEEALFQFGLQENEKNRLYEVAGS